MKMFSGLACLPGLLLAVAAFGVAAEKPPKKPKPQLAKKINTVTYEFQKSDPPQFVVTASTTVPTGGYKAELRRATYVMPPKDGIQDYHLYLIKPDGFVTQVISEVSASDSWQTDAAALGWLKGVRIHGEGDGVVVKMFEEKKK